MDDDPPLVSAAYRLSRRDAARLLVAESPASFLAASFFVAGGVLRACFLSVQALSLSVPLGAVLLILGRGRRVRTLVHRRAGDHTLTADGEGLGYTTPTDSGLLPWRVCATPRSRFGTWVIPLDAAPHRALLVPRWLLRPEDDAALAALFAERIPRRGPRPDSRPDPRPDPRHSTDPRENHA